MTEPRWVRAAVVRIYDHADRTVILDARGGALELRGDSAELARAVLAHLAQGPRSRGEILDHLADLSGGPITETTAIDQLLAVLKDARVITAPEASAAPTTPGRRIVLGISGAIAAMHTPALVQALLARGHRVRVMATNDARRFVSIEALAALTHQVVSSDLWSGTPDAPVPHLELAEWAELMVIAPASATTLSRIATGDCSDLVAAAAISTRAPVLLAPSMNPAMLSAPAVARNIEQLRGDGFRIIHSAFGLEVAETPEARQPLLGPSPPAAALLDIVEQCLQER